MSLLEEINKKKANLSHTTTTVMLEDGRTFLQELKNGNEYRTQLSRDSHGYVVDTKPDLQVAKIVPGLFLGSQDPAKDEELLLAHGITHVLSIGVKIEPTETSRLSYCFLPALDLPEFQITTVFNQCFAFINSVIEAKGSVFVHCNAGVSRSPIIVIGYLINKYGYSFEYAYKMVKEIRPSISPNPGFIQQLKMFE